MPGLSNWREEFNLSEVVTGKMTDKEALRKVSEKKGIKNKVIINPKLDEAVNEIGGEVISMVEQDTDAQKQRLDRKQMILDRQKLKLRRKDMSQAKQEKKQGVEGEATGALKQGNVIAQEGVMKMVKRVMSKKKPEKKAEKAMDAGARARRILQQKDHETVNFLPMNEQKDAYKYVVSKLKKKYGDGVLTTGEKMKPPTAAQKKAKAEHEAKLAKERAAEFKKDPSQGRYSRPY